MYESNEKEEKTQHQNGNGKPPSPQAEFALRWLGMGYNLIPVSGKFPPCLGWKEFQSRRVTTDEITSWSRNKFKGKNGEWSARILNWGLPTGHKPYSDAPAIIVVDSDDGEGDQLVRERCPETPCKQRTGKGGWHRVYRRPDTDLYPYIANRQKTHFGGKVYNVDIRGDGGYILAPGSIHPETGRQYVEESPWTAEQIAQAPEYDPDWLPDERATADRSRAAPHGEAEDWESDEDFLEAIKTIPVPMDDREKQARRYLNRVPGTKEGTGADRACSWLAIQVLKGFALPPEVALACLKDWGEKADQLDQFGGWYPWTEDQLRRKLTWAMAQSYSGRIGDRLNQSLDTILANLSQQVDQFFAELAQADDEEDKARAKLETEAKPKPAPAPLAGKYQFAPLSASEFAAAHYTAEWLVQRLLVRGQPCIMGGPKKSLKTSLLTALTLSLGSGKPFLDYFKVYKPVRTVLVSGESGGFTLQETANRQCVTMGIQLADTLTHWDFRLPQLSQPEELAELSRGLAERQIEVAIIDPLYLCLLAGQDGASKNAGSVYDMGPLLLSVANACLAVGCTPIMCHHARKNLVAPHEPLELDDLAFVGIQEFARQWLLVNRRTRYVPGTGLHQLWLTAGGSVGHGGLWGLDIAEGQLQDDFTGRTWATQILTLDEAKAEATRAREDKKEVADGGLEDKLLAKLRQLGGSPTKNKLQEGLGWGAGKFKRILDRLIAKEKAELVTTEATLGNGGKRETQVVRELTGG